MTEWRHCRFGLLGSVPILGIWKRLHPKTVFDGLCITNKVDSRPFGGMTRYGRAALHGLGTVPAEDFPLLPPPVQGTTPFQCCCSPAWVGFATERVSVKHDPYQERHVGYTSATGNWKRPQRLLLENNCRLLQRCSGCSVFRTNFPYSAKALDLSCGQARRIKMDREIWEVFVRVIATVRQNNIDTSALCSWTCPMSIS